MSSLFLHFIHLDANVAFVECAMPFKLILIFSFPETKPLGVRVLQITFIVILLSTYFPAHKILQIHNVYFVKEMGS